LSPKSLKQDYPMAILTKGFSCLPSYSLENKYALLI
jgi:hypothetical protein